MAIEYIQKSFGSSKGILAFPDHYVAFAKIFPKASAGSTGLATLVGDRYIIKAGTIYPANGSTAIGVVMNDLDVTYGDQNGAVILHGFIKTANLPEIPTSDAIAALKHISFIPLESTGLALTGTKAAIATGATKDPEPVVFKLVNAEFREGAEDDNNWTIAGGGADAGTKLTVKSITIGSDNKTVTFGLKQNAAAVNGNLTVIPSASIISIGKTVAAVTIATVATPG